MATAFEELRVLQDAEVVADEIWRQLEWLQTVPILDHQSLVSKL
jgi:hypothetical protein